MIQKFAKTALERITIDGGGYRRDHLRALAQRVEVADGEVRIMGSKGDLLKTLVAASGVIPAAGGVPSSAPIWLAAHEYGTSGNSNRNSSLGNAIASSCIFHDVTLGDTDTACAADSGALYNCYLPSGATGVLSNSNNAYLPAFTTGVGWDFATGIGTVNLANLVMNWQPMVADHADAALNHAYSSH